jgi:plastocyanin
MQASITTVFPRPSIGVRRPVRRRTAPSALGKLAAAASIGIAGLLTYTMAGVFREFVPPMAVIAAIGLLIAAGIARGWRWAPALAAILSLLVGGLLIAPAAGEIAYTLTHPGDPMFTVLVVLFPVLGIGLASGVAATVQNYRSGERADRRAPRWLAPALAAIAGVSAGAILVGAIPHSSAAGVSPEVLASLPALGTKGFAFEQTELHVKAGETVALRLENADAAAHVFDVDELSVHAPMPAGQSGLALFRPTTPGTYTFYCSLHYDKASGQGMKGTLVVEP